MKVLSPVATKFFWPTNRVSSSLINDFLKDEGFFSDSSNDSKTRNANNFYPRCDIQENEKHYVICFDVPGVSKDDIQIEINDGRLLISGKRNSVVKDEKNKFLIKERDSGAFERSFKFSDSINEDKIDACLNDGVLNLILTKTETPKAKKIEIQSGSDGFFNKIISSKA
jgi:HSP20 family protein